MSFSKAAPYLRLKDLREAEGSTKAEHPSVRCFAQWTVGVGYFVAYLTEARDLRSYCRRPCVCISEMSLNGCADHESCVNRRVGNQLRSQLEDK